MPKRPCIEAGCGNFATYRGRCPEHAREQARDINRRRKGNYDNKRWRLARRHQLFIKPLCDCGAIATFVHHTLGIEHDPNHRQLESLCGSCHSKLHRQGASRAKIDGLQQAPNGRTGTPRRTAFRLSAKS
jgi:hypothetical protein